MGYRFYERKNMSKDINTNLISFGHHLAQLRKAAGYTQSQLADEIGTTRRKIAYYETESPHPPANLLIELAQALAVSTDDLLGLTDSNPKPKAGSRLERRIRQIECLGPKARKQIVQLIDTFIEAEQLKEKVNSGQVRI